MLYIGFSDFVMCYTQTMNIPLTEIDNICKIDGCTKIVTRRGERGRLPSRCIEHSTTCLVPECEVPTDAVRCSKHAARYARLGTTDLCCTCESLTKYECRQHPLAVHYRRLEELGHPVPTEFQYAPDHESIDEWVKNKPAAPEDIYYIPAGSTIKPF